MPFCKKKSLWDLQAYSGQTWHNFEEEQCHCTIDNYQPLCHPNSSAVHWHTRYEAAVGKLRQLNTGVCRVTGKAFGELIQHFILGGDETCMQGNAGSLRIVGSVERKKHDVNYNDGRTSITMYRTGAVSGEQGPTTFLLKGLRKPHGFTVNFLEKNGVVVGSTIVMTENAYMTEVAWETMTPVLVKGIRSMSVIKDNPQWWAIEVFDGFGPHTSSYYAMKHRYDNKILCLKEEGDCLLYTSDAADE